MPPTQLSAPAVSNGVGAPYLAEDVHEQESIVVVPEAIGLDAKGSEGRRSLVRRRAGPAAPTGFGAGAATTPTCSTERQAGDRTDRRPRTEPVEATGPPAA